MDRRKAFVIATINSASPYEMANLADVRLRGLDTSGANFLTGIRDDLAEAVEGLSDDELDNITDRLDYDGRSHEIADSAVPNYNSDRWEVMHDLNAYYEDISDYGTPENMLQAAAWSLYVVAKNVVGGLLERAQDALIDADDEEAMNAND